MFHPTFSDYRYSSVAYRHAPGSKWKGAQTAHPPNLMPAASMTREASIQTYYTIRYLADKDRADDAYRAYAYFRWVDDRVDQDNLTRAERLAFLARQREIVGRCYRGERPSGLLPEEQMAAELIHGDCCAASGLRTYIHEMMAVMAFDAERRGRPVTAAELDGYTRSLATAVTEVLHHFIGHHCFSPPDDSRYLAVTGAHITHLLRDTVEDTAAGYFNIPREYLETHGIAAGDFDHDLFRAWVKQRVQLARSCFEAGREYMARVENVRCRLAGFAYIGRFEIILDAIERDNYRLRAAYPERRNKKHMLKIALAALSQAGVRIR